MKFLSTEEGKVGSLVGANFLFAAISGQTTISLEAVLRMGLLLAQIAVAVLTAWYIYQKGKKP